MRKNVYIIDEFKGMPELGSEHDVGREDSSQDFGIEKMEYANLTEGSEALVNSMLKWEADHPDEKNFIIIAGPSGSGKDTLIKEIAHSPDEETHLSLDRYYLGSELQKRRQGRVNFSIPEALDQERIQDDIEKINNAQVGDVVEVPLYSMSHSKRVGQERLHVRRRIIIEGVYALNQVHQDTPFKIYVDARPDTLLERKLHRDAEERGIHPDLVKKRFQENVLPATEEFVVPQKELASIVIHNDTGVDEKKE
jgi:uridine kinase